MRTWTVLFVGVLTLWPSCALAQTASQSSATLHQLFLEDQNDMPTQTPRTDPSPEAIKAFAERAAARRARLHAMLSLGEITSGNDLYEAAFIFQHGETAPDYLLAHVLALDALAKGFDRARWLSVATLDRYLQLIDQPQVFGTQYPFDPKMPHPVTNGGRFSGRTQLPFDEMFLPAYIRRDFCVPDLEQQKKNLQTLNAGSYPRDTMTLPGCER
ncbi:MAG: hypothetical protein M3Y50_00020 [Acidobacteriota bacterium]|nr:hypothetical protein [Acidobacteriota bacterium]